MELAHLSLGLGRGDEVVVPSFTFPSTATAALRAGARVRFADISDETLNVTPETIRPLLTGRTRAVVVVHYAGRACDMGGIMALARSRGFRVIEDAAHALGATHRGRPLGTWGDFGCFSFHQTKNLTCGEGGALAVGRSRDVPAVESRFEKGTDRLRFLRGEIDRYQWISEGGSFGLSALLAAVVEVQLGRARAILGHRRRIAGRYRKALSGGQGPWRLPGEDAETNWHLFAVRVPARLRDPWIAWMRGKGIEVSSHYEPLHLSPFAQEALGWRTPLPVTERAAAEIIRLPIHPGMTNLEVDRVVEAFLTFPRIRW
jgi:dTDP-4-amino-4,6-dideoxygalactose transaminase